MAEANRWTEIHAINAFLVCVNVPALDEFHTAPTKLKQPKNGEPDPTLRTHFVQLVVLWGVCQTIVKGEASLSTGAKK